MICFKKCISCLISVIMILALCTPIVAKDEPIVLISYEGGLESAYVKWDIYSGADGYNVYSKKTDGDYIKLDDELIRTYATYVRADALGLSEGVYTLKVVPTNNGAEISDGAVETPELTVLKHNREGFAFSENSPQKTASGAYNDDGTLKPDADIIYITNGNKDTITINGDASLGVGLREILSYREAKKITTTLDIRLIGCVTDPAGLDNHTVRFINTNNVTLEGVGDDAVVYGWIMTLKRTENFEIRNLATMYGGLGADASAIVLDTDNKNVWIHNCDFFYGAPGKDADQVKGDGAVDLKSRSDYVTLSYNHLWDMGKTAVSGGPWEVSNVDDERAKVFVTYHHNWFDHSDSRHPRCVAGSNHVYNNYYDGNSMYGIGAAVKTSVFSENNYYRNCARPMIIASQGSDCWDETTHTYLTKGTLSGQIGGMVKTYGDTIVGAKRFYDQNTTPDEGQFDAYTATSRDEQVPDTIHAYSGGATYNNFDTNADVMYDYSVDTPEVAVEKIKKYAGRVDGGDFKWVFNNDVEDTNHAVITELLNAILAYKQSVVSVGNGTIPVDPPGEPTPDPNATATPTIDPSITPTPNPTLNPGPNGDGVTEMQIGSSSYARDWNDGLAISAGTVSKDGFVYCYKGIGNSYKTNSFNAGGVSITRGYQVKQVDSRSFYIRPAQECMVTVYFYTNGTNSLDLYTNSLTTPVASYTTGKSGDYAYSYHYTDVGSPLYIGGALGDINLAGVSIEATEPSEPTSTPSATPAPKFDTPNIKVDKELHKINISVKRIDETCTDAEILIGLYNNDGALITLTKIDPNGNFDVNGIYTCDDIEYSTDTASCKVFIWNTKNLVPYANLAQEETL